jgi:hypothetical protein
MLSQRCEYFLFRPRRKNHLRVRDDIRAEVGNAFRAGSLRSGMHDGRSIAAIVAFNGIAAGRPHPVGCANHPLPVGEGF